jgi:hypothetical protein
MSDGKHIDVLPIFRPAMGRVMSFPAIRGRSLYSFRNGAAPSSNWDNEGIVTF